MKFAMHNWMRPEPIEITLDAWVVLAMTALKSAESRASILHELVHFLRNYESMRFLIDGGIDMTIRDYRWNSTAHGGRSTP